MEQLSNEREELFSLEKSELKRDIDKRSVEVILINKFF